MLAREMNILPTLTNTGSLKAWLKIMLAPASTSQYVDEYYDRQFIEHQNIFMPVVIISLLTLVQILGHPLQLFKNIISNRQHR
jgi:hypothetical protein